MQAMAWWSVPLVAFVIAVVWVSLANRPRPPAATEDSVAEHQRFRQAMGRQVGDAPDETQTPDDAQAGGDASGGPSPRA